jgi:hypothetical protein
MKTGNSSEFGTALGSPRTLQLELASTKWKLWILYQWSKDGKRISLENVFFYQALMQMESPREEQSSNITSLLPTGLSSIAMACLVSFASNSNSVETLTFVSIAST